MVAPTTLMPDTVSAGSIAVPAAAVSDRRLRHGRITAVHRPTRARGREFRRRPSLPQAAPCNGGGLSVVSLCLAAQGAELRANRREMLELEQKVQRLVASFRHSGARPPFGS